MFFTKMHGLGNDFVVIDATKQPFVLTGPQIQAMADRRTGVGFDQLLVIEPAADEQADFHYRIFNADGGEVGQCGNGARCVAQFVNDSGLSDKRKLRFSLKRGYIEATLHDNETVSVDMGVPDFEPAHIPFEAEQIQLKYKRLLNGETTEFSVVGLGNPHAVIQVANVDDIDVANLGKPLSTHECFPEGVNVEFMEVINSKRIRLRVYERGVGETDACGSGACAAVVAGKRLGILDNTVFVTQRGGELLIEWGGDKTRVTMTGPARTVFKGEWLVT